MRGRTLWLGLPFNTWLIVVNILVYLAGNEVLRNSVMSVDMRAEWLEGVSQTQRDGAKIDRSRIFKAPGKPADVYFHSLYVPVRDARGQEQLVEGGRLLVSRMAPLHAVGHFSTGRLLDHWEVWRVITFQFLHANIWHLAFNMLGLWFVGGMVEQALGFKRYAAFYLVCGIFGSLMYLLLNLLGAGLGLRLPGVLFSDPYTPLVGASAGVFGVLLAAAYINPREIVLVMFLIPMQLRTAVYLFVIFAAANLLGGGDNAGGDAAHIGGALAGAFFIRRPHLLRDFFAITPERLASPPRPRGVRRTPTRPEGSEMDRILAKIKDEGLSSLTASERRALQLERERLEG